MKIVSCGCTGEAPESEAVPFRFRDSSFVAFPGRLDANLRAYYPLDDGVPGRDISGVGNHATPSIPPVEYVDGLLCGKSERFDGRQWYAPPFSLADELTVSVWAKPSAEKRETTLLSVGDDLRFGLSWLREPIVWINERRPNEVPITAAAIPSQTWTHLAFVRESQRFAIYVDGQSVDLQYDGQPTAAAEYTDKIETGPTEISRYRNGSGLSGVYQDMVIRAAAMTAAEIDAERRSMCESVWEIVP